MNNLPSAASILTCTAVVSPAGAVVLWSEVSQETSRSCSVRQADVGVHVPVRTRADIHPTLGSTACCYLHRPCTTRRLIELLPWTGDNTPGDLDELTMPGPGLAARQRVVFDLLELWHQHIFGSDATAAGPARLSLSFDDPPPHR
jgi:hypothetical protein